VAWRIELIVSLAGRRNNARRFSESRVEGSQSPVGTTTAEHGNKGAASTDQDQRVQAVSLFITDMLAASIGQG
jgi:hypothetical protein